MNSLGHNNLVGWSIIALLFNLLVQDATGLLANGDIVTEGPFFDRVSKETSDWLTRTHKLNQQVIIARVCIHVLAELFYFFYKREDLVKPVITGIRHWSGAEVESASGRTWIAMVIAWLTPLAANLLVGYVSV